MELPPLGALKMMVSLPKSLSTFFPYHKQQQQLSPSRCQHRRGLISQIIISEGGGGDKGNELNTSQQPVVRTADGVEIRFKRGSRRRRRMEEEGGEGLAQKKAPPPPKDWDAMSVSEKAMELYVGEKGLLFWLNKFAYASIFIVIGGWILFRFVGPSLNLYQLDAPPLPPTSMLKG